MVVQKWSYWISDLQQSAQTVFFLLSMCIDLWPFWASVQLTASDGHWLLRYFLALCSKGCREFWQSHHHVCDFELELRRNWSPLWCLLLRSDKEPQRPRDRLLQGYRVYWTSLWEMLQSLPPGCGWCPRGVCCHLLCPAHQWSRNDSTIWWDVKS